MAHPVEKPIAIRAYSERPRRDPLGMRPPTADSRGSDYELVFDTETTVDASQRLRFGFFQVRRREALNRSGLFYDPHSISPDELDLLQRFAEARGLEIMTVAEFRSGVFLKYGYVRSGTVVGFNLP